MEEVKLCKDCGWREKDICARPAAYTGFKREDYCYYERTNKNDEYACGNEAKYFVPRRPWWKRLLRLK